MPRPPNLTTLAAHSEPHCEPRKEKFARRSSGTFTHFVSCDEGDSRSMIGHGHLETWHQPQRHHRSRRQTASPTSQPQSRRKMPRSESPPSRPLTGVIATPSSNGLPSPPWRIANQKKAPCRREDASPFWDAGAERPPECQDPAIDLVHRQSRSSLVCRARKQTVVLVDRLGGNVAASHVGQRWGLRLFLFYRCCSAWMSWPMKASNTSLPSNHHHPGNQRTTQVGPSGNAAMSPSPFSWVEASE